MHYRTQQQRSPRRAAPIAATRSGAAPSRRSDPLFPTLGTGPLAVHSRSSTRRAWRELVESVGW